MAAAIVPPGPGGAGANPLQAEHRRNIDRHTSTPLPTKLGSDPHKDFPTWRRELFQRAACIEGATEALADVVTVIAPMPVVAMGAPPVLTDAQYLQSRLRALMRLSIVPESPAARLVADLQYASGLEG